MRILGFLIITLALGVSMFSSKAEAKQKKLENGMATLIHEDTRFPLVSLRISVRTGSTNEKAKVAGISHLLEHMVFKRTEKWDNGTAAKKVEEVGGYLNAMTSFDYTTYLVDVPADQWKLGMEVLEQLVFNAVFDEEELEKEKLVVIEELKRGEDNPHNRIFKRVQGISLKGTPYARPIIGSEKTINAITVADLKEYIATNYQPQSMFITVVGNVDSNEVQKDIEKRFAKYKNTRGITPQEPIAMEDIPRGQFIHEERASWRKSYVTLAFPISGYRDNRSIEVDVLAGVLAGDLNAPLQKKYKYDMQLVDSFSIDAIPFRNVGMLYISAETDPEKLEPFMKELLKDLSTIEKRTYSKKEVEKMQFRMEDSLLRSRATISGMASLLNYFQLTSDSPFAEENYLSLVKNVQAEKLPAVAKTWFNPEQLTVVTIVPSKSPKVDIAGIVKEHWSIKKIQKQEDTKSSKEKEQKSQHKNDATEKGIMAQAEVVDLGNGKTVIFLPDATLPYTSISMEYSGGMMLNTKAQLGLEKLTANMLTSGTKKHSALEIEEYLTSRSSSISASAGRTTFGISTTQPAKFTKDILVLLKEVIEQPTFPESDIAKEKQNLIAEIASTEDRPTNLLFRELYPFLFPNQRYGDYITGTKESVEKLSQKELREYWEKQRTQKMVISVAGVFDKEEILQFVQSLPSGNTKAVEIPFVQWGKDAKKAIHTPDKAQTHILLTYKTTDIYSKDTPALMLLQAVLGGQSGILFRELREKQGLAYTVRAMDTQGQRFGFFSFYIGTSPEKEKVALDSFNKVIASIIAKPISKAELEKGKRQIEGDYYRKIQSFGARASSASSNTIFELPITYNQQIIEEVKKLTPADVQAVAKKYFNTKNTFLLVVSPNLE